MATITVDTSSPQRPIINGPFRAGIRSAKMPIIGEEMKEAAAWTARRPEVKA
jgi:hypothetical protein